MCGKSCQTVCLLVFLLSVSDVPLARAAHRGGYNNNSAAARRQRLIAGAQQQLAMCRQVLASAEAAISEAQGQVSTADERIEGARKTISEARTTAHESTKSQKAIEAEILSGQSGDSDYARAHLAFQEAQDELKSAQENVLTSSEYLAQKAAISKEEDHAAKLAKLQHDALENDTEYQHALEKMKAAKIVHQRLKSELLKASAEWVAAADASHEASAEESKANGEATRGAFKKLPAIRNLREAKSVAADARAGIAEAEMVLKSLGAPIPKAPPGQGSYTTAPSSSNR